MSPKKRKYKKEYAYTLAKISSDDLYAAEFLISAPKYRPETVLFLIHQSIEKALKAYLCFLEIPIEHTHELNVLISFIPEAHQPKIQADFSELTQFATVRRYESGPEEISADDIKSVLRLGFEIKAWLSSALFIESDS